MSVPFNVGAMFDFGKPLPKLDVAPEHYIDYTPDDTRRAVEAMMSINTSPEGQFCGKEWMERVKAFAANPEPGSILITFDSITPLNRKDVSKNVQD